MKKIFQTLGLLIIIGSFSTFSHTEQNSDALLDAINNPKEIANIQQEIILETLMKHFF